MRIKSLNIVGFKSFYEKTKIQFDSELSAIVGPNGCGKSNVIDAIRWILGEQNPRQLRAEIMEQLISNGSEFMKPLGMAEVALVLENVPSYEFEEVEIKRRVFRSGESEYYLNGTTCRLKDITDIFIDTGSGARSYSVISQGSVDQLITAKPEDKRVFIEEVAGIRKYKIRRRETETRIRNTKDNLSRVEDMSEEVKRQMDSLSAQAEKAQEFRELSEKAEQLELRINKARLYRLQVKKSEKIGEKESLKKNLAETERESASLSAELRELEGKANSLEDYISQLDQKNYQTKADLQSRESSQELIKSEITSIDKFIEKMETEIVLLKRESSNIDEVKEDKRETLRQLAIDLESELKRIAEKEESLTQLRSGSSGIREELNDIRTKLFQILNDYSSLKGAALGHERELEELKSKKDTLLKEISEAEAERNRSAEEITKSESILSENEARKLEITEENTRLVSEVESLKSGLREKESELESASRRHKEESSRLSALDQIQSRYEWLPEGIGKFILSNKGKGILGTVSDFISVPDGYEKAVEASLGDKMNWIVVKENSRAISSIETFRNESLGRGTFITADNNGDGASGSRVVSGLKQLADIVRAEGAIPGVIDELLRSTYLVGSVSEGLESRASGSDNVSYVTAEGDYIHSNGAIAGGTTQQGAIARKKEIEKLGESTGILAGQIETITRDIDSLRAGIETHGSRIKENERLLIEIGIREAETKKDITNLRRNLEKVQNSIEIIERNSRQTDIDIGEKSRLFDETKEKINLLDREKSKLESDFKSIEEKIKNAEENEKSLEREIADIKVLRASLIEKEKNLKEDLVELDKRKEEITEKLNTEYHSIEQRKTEKLEFIERDRQNTQEIKDFVVGIRSIEEELALKREERSKVLENIRAANIRKEEIGGRVSDLRMRINSVEHDIDTAHSEIASIREKIYADDETEETYAVNYQMPEGTEHEGLEEFSGLNITEEEASLKRLQGRIDRFGPVNLLAPEEYEKLNERYTFLTEQIEDLTKALASLSRAISKIDKESEKRFAEAYEVMDKKFQEIFNRLFRGGEGKLVLTEPENMLETGVDVIVRPRGKKFQSINLLSGGEKALSAIALIISACLIKPAPFLLFDEIDAPLDDRNTTYFMELIKEIDKNSQVVLITHNKKTMQEVNSLIGITSNKSGTSTVVSVELN